MSSILLAALISGMIFLAVWGLFRFFVTKGQPLVPLKRTIRLIRQVKEGDWRQVLYVIYLKLRRLDVGYVSSGDLGLSPDTGHRHENSGGPNLGRVLKNFSINKNDSILDIGCGKGGALITFSKFDFQVVDGLDISDDLLSIAKTNFKKLNIRKVKLFQANAVTFTNLDNYTFIYMANPFPCNIVKSVMLNLDMSIKKHPREITLIYYNPVCHDVIVSNSDFRIIMKFDNFGIPFWVYKNIISPQ